VKLKQAEARVLELEATVASQQQQLEVAQRQAAAAASRNLQAASQQVQQLQKALDEEKVSVCVASATGSLPRLPGGAGWRCTSVPWTLCLGDDWLQAPTHPQ
jgi:hypothetical protein